MAGAALGRQPPGEPETPAQGPPPFESLRYNEDFSYLRYPAARTRAFFAFEPIKYIPLNDEGDWYLTIGGEIREQYELIKNPNFGTSPEDNDGYLLHLYLLHGDLHVGRSLRLFGQLRSASASFQEDVAGPGSSLFPDVQQAFVDLGPLLWDEERRERASTLRVGRQEMSYGAERMISTRVTIRRTFDAVRLLNTLGDWHLDAFFSRPVEVDPETFEHEGEERARFWGVYATGPVGAVPGLTLDLYYLGIDQPGAVFALGTADEPRHTVGGRLSGEAGGFGYDIEGAYQWGELGPLDISAWRFASDTTYTFDMPLRPLVGLRLDVTTGDEERGDGRFDTFIPLFPKGNPFGASPLIGPVNLITVEPLAQLALTDSLSLNAGWAFYWRYSENDGVYNDGLRLIQADEGNDSRYIGNELSIGLDWQVNRQLSVSMEYSHFFTGSFLNETGPGRDVDYFSVLLSFRF